jgi:hypothetical protein
MSLAAVFSGCGRMRLWGCVGNGVRHYFLGLFTSLLSIRHGGNFTRLLPHRASAYRAIMAAAKPARVLVALREEKNVAPFKLQLVRRFSDAVVDSYHRVLEPVLNSLKLNTRWGVLLSGRPVCFSPLIQTGDAQLTIMTEAARLRLAAMDPESSWG